MRIELFDWQGYNFRIDSSDPELLGRWLVETLLKTKPDFANPARIQVWPSFTADGKPDWIADSRVIGVLENVYSPQDVINHLQGHINRLAELSGHAAHP
jgi:hypothetical protein